MEVLTNLAMESFHNVCVSNAKNLYTLNLYSICQTQLSKTVKEKHPDCKGGSILPFTSLFTDDMVLFRENPKEFMKKLLELINKFRKVAGCKNTTQKSAAFFILAVNTENIIRKAILFAVA